MCPGSQAGQRARQAATHDGRGGGLGVEGDGRADEGGDDDGEGELHGWLKESGAGADGCVERDAVLERSGRAVGEREEVRRARLLYGAAGCAVRCAARGSVLPCL